MKKFKPVREVIIISIVLELHIVEDPEEDLEQIFPPVSLELVPVPGKAWGVGSWDT